MVALTTTPLLARRCSGLLPLLAAVVVHGWTVGDAGTANVFASDPQLLRWSEYLQGGYEKPNALLARWSSGMNTSFTDGLKGGIAWAFDPRLCDSLLPLFPEEVNLISGGWLPGAMMPSLIQCGRIKAGVRAAMNAWEAANSNVRFIEVTNMCENAWVTVDPRVAPPPSPSMPPLEPPSPLTPPSPPSMPPFPPSEPPLPPTPPEHPPPPPYFPGFAPTPPANWTIPIPPIPPPLEPGALTHCDNATLAWAPCVRCPYAELIISGFDAAALPAEVPRSDRLDGTGAARAPLAIDPNQDPPSVESSDYRPGQWLRGDYRSGTWIDGFAPMEAAAGNAIHSATIQLDVNPDRCWWYDDLICEGLFESQAENSDVDIYALIITFLFIAQICGYLLAGVIVLARIYTIFQLTALAWDTDGDGIVEFSEIRDALKIISSRSWLRLKALLQGEPPPEVSRDKQVEWKAALYGVLYAIGNLNIIIVLIFCIFVFYPPELQYAVIRPCHDCIDFHAVLLRQVGLVLGLQTYVRPPDPFREANWTVPPPPNLPPLPPSPLPPLAPPDNFTVPQGPPLPLLPPPPSPPPPPPVPPAPPSPPPPSPPEPPQPPEQPHAPPPWNLTAPVPPTYLYNTDNMYGYNCSVPEQGVTYLNLEFNGPPVKPSLMSGTIPDGLRNAWPRYTCPMNDDGDGLRFLYPECDELLDCEGPGGREVTYNNVTGCERYTPTVSGAWYDIYSIVDYYVPTASNNWSHPNYTWHELGQGRAVADVTCVVNYQLGQTGSYRCILLFLKAVIPPLALVIGLKIISVLVLYLPFMRAVRKRNEKLQRTAEKRKAEVRRMADEGHEFAVKRLANKGGQGGSIQDEVMNQIHARAQQANPEYKSEKQKQADRANALLQATRAKKSSVRSLDSLAPAAAVADAPAGAGAGLGEPPASASACSDSPAAAWPATEPAATEPQADEVQSQTSYAPVSQFAADLKALSAQSIAEEEPTENVSPSKLAEASPEAKASLEAEASPLAELEAAPEAAAAPETAAAPAPST
uniref:EF-hand domain-containing protein n=1 Tax=Haptolina brevifila TaxID=156173 RepID=A0A7S2GE38_9EUKA